MDKDKSSKRSHDHHRDRDGEHRHRHRDRDDKHRDHHHHRSSDHKSSRRDERERSRDREKSIDERDFKREKSHDDRERDRDFKREKSHEERDSRRDRDRSREVKREEFDDGDDVASEVKKKRKARDESEERGEKKNARVLDEKREKKRRFEDNFVKEEEDDGGISGNANVSEIYLKQEVNGHDSTNAGGSANSNGAAVESITMASRTSPDTTMAAGHPPFPTKVSSISTTNENKGVSITRSHEVHGKSSTDGTSSAAGKSGSLSLDALAKAKKALQMQKELSEKLKKIPTLSKGSSSDGSGKVQGPAATASDAAAAAAAASVQPPTSSVPAFPGLANITNIEAVKRAQELAAKMGFRQDPEFAPIINCFPGQPPVDAAVPQKPTKAPVLRVDALGREIDEHGNVVNRTKPSNLSTLKVNINKQKKDAFQILKPELEVDPNVNPHFDPRMGINKSKLLRPKRMTFQFVEEGKWSKEAEILRVKSQFGEAGAKERQAKQAQLAKAKGGTDINPNLIEVAERVITKEKPKDPIPEIEWWDAPLLLTGSYADISDDVTIEDKLKREKITIYVEHPRPIEPPAEPAPPPPQPLKLTKKEQKKLRTQRRLAREKDRQEMIRQGLIEPPKPKVKMSNLMKVLGSEATQDPTRLEKEIRSAAAEREQAHIDRNIARKLTPAERREKKERKLFDDPSSVETIVSVYKINDLSHPKTRFKVDVNAHENRLTGCAVICEGINVVVVEGGSKSIKRYGKLMLRRIDWAKAVKEEDEDEDETTDKPVNKCVLVWQGNVARPSFNRFFVHECMTEAAAKKVFADAGVAHYWDLAVNFNDEI
ncbi:protein RDM16 [Citrus sinensis]|nr:protein RDM16 [Citrus sinensis]